MDETKFAELKKIVFAAKKFGPVWDFFLDHFVDCPAFFKMGRGVPSNPVFDQVLGQVAISCLNAPEAILATWRLVNIPEHQFTHGAGTLNGYMTQIFHFDDEEVGMFNVVVGPSMTHMARFSTKKVAPFRGEPSRN